MRDKTFLKEHSGKFGSFISGIRKMDELMESSSGKDHLEDDIASYIFSEKPDETNEVMNNLARYRKKGLYETDLAYNSWYKIIESALPKYSADRFHNTLIENIILDNIDIDKVISLLEQKFLKDKKY